MPHHQSTRLTAPVRPRTLRRILIAAAVGAVLAGAGIGAGIARADTETDLAAILVGDAVCTTLDTYPTTDGVLGVALALMEEGWSGEEAGAVIGAAVIRDCPRHVPLLTAFAAQWGGD